MQTINQQRNLKRWNEIMQDVRPNWEHMRNGHPCRQEDFEAERSTRHREPGDSLLSAVIGGAIVILVLSYIGVIP